MKTNPLEWWQGREMYFPRLTKLATKYVCIQATSVASERVFSTTGDIVSAKRACLSPWHVNALVFLKKNMTFWKTYQVFIWLTKNFISMFFFFVMIDSNRSLLLYWKLNCKKKNNLFSVLFWYFHRMRLACLIYPIYWISELYISYRIVLKFCYQYTALMHIYQNFLINDWNIGNNNHIDKQS